MKVLKILGGVIAVLVAAVVVVWAMFLRAPSQEDMCAHLGDLMEKKTPGFLSSPPGTEFKNSCPAQMKKGSMEGQVKYVKRAKCVMAADSLDGVDACRG